MTLDERPDEALERPLLLRNDASNDDAVTATSGDAGDVRTTLALWNCMVGSSVLAAPWAFTESGLALGAALAVFIGTMMAYTSTLVLRYGVRGGHDDISAMCGAHLGRWARVGGNVAMALMLAQTVVVFDMMLSTSVYGIVKGFAGLRRERTAALGDMYERIPRFRQVLESVHGGRCYGDRALTAWRREEFGRIRCHERRRTVLHDIFDFLHNFQIRHSGEAGGSVSALGKFLHVRQDDGFSHKLHVFASCDHSGVPNLLVAYALTLISYLVPAVAGNFSAAYVAVRSGPDGSSRAANFLRVYPPSDYYTLSAHAAITVQFLTMVPLLLYILRVQVSALIPGVPAKYESIFSFVINVSVIALGSFCAAHPRIDIGFILSKAGGIFGLIFAYTAPVLVHIFGRSRPRNGHPMWNHAIHGAIFAVGLAVAIAQFVQ
ncbi:amino acid transporter protein [Ostreococcus tauri]|uniref:Amino acid transporter protein n=1 Tax=Ostreococcus tauri TaxID=70448 RepID=A0A1Y5HZ20_OSTTA|nr:amino acid transporter protein [Ostreococcus tauri]